MSWLRVLLLVCVTCYSTIGVAGQKAASMLTGTIVELESGEPLVGIELRLIRIKSSFFSMRKRVVIGTVISDTNGEFTFHVKKKGPYTLTWNPEGNVLWHEHNVGKIIGVKKIIIEHEDEADIDPPWDH